MNPTPIVFSFLLVITSAAMAASVTEKLYSSADAQSKKGNFKTAYEMFQKAAHEARKSKNSKFEFYAYYSSAFCAYKTRAYTDTKKNIQHAIDCAAQNRTQTWVRSRNISQIKIELLGLAERVARIEQRITEGWELNHKATREWQKLSARQGAIIGSPLHPAHIANCSTSLRSLGWRLLEREAAYLHLVGRTSEARALLNEAVKHIGNDTQSSHQPLSLYSCKIIQQLALIESFTGYKKKAAKLYELALKEHIRSQPSNKPSLYTIKLNLFSTIADIQGVTEDVIKEVDKIIADSEQKKYYNLQGLKRLAVKIKNSSTKSHLRQSILEQLALENKNIGDQTEVLFTSRNALFEQAKRGQAGLDTAFNQFINKVRRSGDKKAEPRIYRVYGDWLRTQNRQSEALRVYYEALRMNRSFEWDLMTPWVMAKIGATYLESGHADQAWQIWEDMKQLLQNNPAIPGYVYIRCHSLQINAMIKANLIKEARALAAETLDVGTSKNTSEYWLALVRPEFVNQLVSKLGETDKPQPNTRDPQNNTVIIHPVAMNTLNLQTFPAEGSFFLINPKSTSISGTISLTGKGVTLATVDGSTLPTGSFDPDLPKRTVSHRVIINGGSFVEFHVASTKPFTAKEDLRFELVWQSDIKHHPAQKAFWGVTQSEDKRNHAILDSAQYRPTPYLGLPVLHHIHFPGTDTAPVGFRMRSPVVQRLEYRETGTGKLIAVDDNGNGIFTDKGDFVTPRHGIESHSAFPTLLPEKKLSVIGIEVWIYANPDTKFDGDILLPLELHRAATGWTEYSRDVIRGKSK